MIKGKVYDVKDWRGQALDTPNPYDDEKGEMTSHTSTAVTPLSEAEPSGLGYKSDLSDAKIVQCLSEGKKQMEDGQCRYAGVS